MSDSKKVLVTGANGFIGSALVRGLVERGYSVKSLVLKGTPETFLDGIDTEIVYGDITDPSSLKASFRDAGKVFHLAALARDWGPKWLFRKLNYEGVLNVLDVAERTGVERLVHISTLGVHTYRPTFGGDETAPLDSNLNYYCIFKRLAEQEVRKRMANGRMPITIIRPPLFPFGPRDTTSFYALADALEKGIYQYINGGSARVCVGYVENLADGMIAAIEHPAAVGEVFNINDDGAKSWREIMETFCKSLGAKPPRFSVPSAALYPVAAIMMGLWLAFPLPGEPPLTFYRVSVSSQDLYFTNEKAKRVLGWQPKVSFDEAARRTVEWYKSVKGKIKR